MSVSEVRQHFVKQAEKQIGHSVPLLVIGENTVVLKPMTKPGESVSTRTKTGIGSFHWDRRMSDWICWLPQLKPACIGWKPNVQVHVHTNQQPSGLDLSSLLSRFSNPGGRGFSALCFTKRRTSTPRDLH